MGAGIPVTDLLNLNCNSALPLPSLNSSCSLLSTLHNFESTSMRINAVRPATFPDPLHRPLHIATAVPFYGRGTIFLTGNGTVDTATPGTAGARNVNDAIDFIVSGARAVPWHMTTTTAAGGQEHFFLVKKGDIPSLDLDISRLRTALPAVNFTTKREATDTSLAIQAENLTLNVSYVRDTTASVDGFSAFFRDLAVQRAWNVEKSRMAVGIPGTGVAVGISGTGVAVGIPGTGVAWSDGDKALLKSQGHVPGYTGHLRRDIDAVPQLAGEPGNVVFVRG